jgi:HPt (histidine-containing phosphotransfer) domain-containing protein
VAVFERARIEELRAVLGEARLEGLIDLLMAECRERPPRLRTEHYRGDLAALRAQAHSLFAAAASIGANALREAALHLEAVGTLDSAAPLIEALDQAARDTLGAAQQMLSRFGKEGTPCRDSCRISVTKHRFPTGKVRSPRYNEPTHRGTRRDNGGKTGDEGDD